MSKVVIRSRK